MKNFTIPAATTIGHVHLKVADMPRSLEFYRDLLGFEVVTQWDNADGSAAFLSAGGYHHHIGLNTWYPDNNGVELYVDRPKKDWPRTLDGNIDFHAFAKRVQPEDLLKELS